MNAILKPEHIETIFDYDLSNEEHQILAHGVSEIEYIEQLKISTFSDVLKTNQYFTEN